jgi:hypothetical protein
MVQHSRMSLLVTSAEKPLSAAGKYETMADLFDRLKSALSDRYAIERELGSGGMACQAGRRTGGPAGSCYG